MVQPIREVSRRQERWESSGRVAPQVAVDELRRAFPRDGILVVDVGAHKQAVLARWKSFEPNTFLNTNGMSAMGASIGMAIAAKLARPERPVATVTGDGGFLMFAGELETVARLELPLLVVVMNDGCLSTIKVKQAKAGCPAAGVYFGAPDYVALARGFGLLGFRARTREECRTAFDRALESGRGALVEVLVNYEEYPRLDSR